MGNKNTQEAKRRPSVLLKPKSLSLKAGWLKQMRLLPREAAVPWPSLNPASGSSRLNLEAYNAGPLKLTRPSKRLNAESRSSNSNKMKIIRSKLRKLKKLLPSTWPNTARPNKDLKKLRRELRWLVPKWPVLALLSKLTTANYQL